MIARPHHAAQSDSGFEPDKEAAALPVEMSEMPPIVQCDLQSPPGPERPGGDVRRSRRSQQDEDEDEVTGLKTAAWP